VRYLEADDALVVVAANGGSPTPPNWYRNLVATPEVQVQRGGETLPLRARKAAGAEERARRRLPAIVLERLITAQPVVIRSLPSGGGGWQAA